VSRRPPTFAVTLVALAIVFALAWMFFLRSGPSASAPLVNGVQGTYTWEPANGGGQTGAFSAVAGGDAGGDAEAATTTLGGQPPVSAYTASSRTESTLVRKGAVAAEVRTVGEWPPVWRLATHSPLDYQGLAAVVRTAVEDGDDAVGIKPLEDGGRAVWRAALTMTGKQIALVVDQKTGVVTWYSDGDDTFTAQVGWASPPPAGSTYTVDAPAGTEVKTIEAGDTEYVASPAAAGRVAGYAPLVSEMAPDGYGLRAVSSLSAGGYVPLTWAGRDGSEAGPVPPPREPAVGQLYTRGLSWFTMEQIGPGTTRFLGADWQDWPAATDEKRLSLQQTTLQYGTLKGATAYTWYQESGPSLFVSGARRAVFVTGALTRQELIAFAEGLKPAPEDAGP
jgi:hypothetical protein